MALSTDKKLYVALAILAVLGVALYLQNQRQQAEALSYTPEGRQADLPQIKATDESIKKIDKVVLVRSEKDDKKKDEENPEAADKAEAADKQERLEIVLEKKGDEWHLKKPVDALANQANVKSLLDNLKTLKVREVIAKSKDAYEQYEVTDDKALHARFYAGNDLAHEFYIGQTGGRGQMARLGDKEGVYALKGYSSYLYARDVKGWRDTSIFKFDEKKAKTVQITNENGKFVFEKVDKEWKVTPPFPDFASSKVDDMLRAYKSLNANGFGDDKKPEEVGLTKPSAEVVITLEDGGKRVVKVGDKAEGSSRWIQTADSDQIYSISSWAGDWATAKVEKFQKKEEKKDETGEHADEPHADLQAEH